MSKWLFTLLRLSRRIWVRTGMISALAVLAALMSPVLGPLLPDRLTESITLDATRRLLDILSTTMLTITTFSLTVITAAHLTAAQTATPRVHQLLREDPRTQTVFATFMGAFVYALVTIVLLNLRIHEREDFGTVYLFTVAVILMVSVAVLRWVQHLSTLGALDQTLDMVEAETRASLQRRRATPWLGGRPAEGPVAAGSVPLECPGFGYLQTIDLPRLDRIAQEVGGSIRLAELPGAYLSEGQTLAWLDGPLARHDPAALARAFVRGTGRTYTHDPAYGLIVLSEIASRALSPAVNDPRSAEAVAIRLHRLLTCYARPATPPEPDYPWLTVPGLDPDLLLRLSFDPIARDGSGIIELQLRLQKLLARLAQCANPDFAAAARAASARALEHAVARLPLSEDIARLRAAAPVSPPDASR